MLLYINLFVSLFAFAQNEQLAQHYFDKGEFEKALISYQELLKSQSGNDLYFQKTIECYQQLQQFEKSEKAIQERWDKYKQASLLVELGYNFQLLKEEGKAKKYYEQALDKITKNPSEVYGIAAIFEKKGLLSDALKAYQIALELDANFNFNFQMALLYGQLGDMDQMIEKFLIESFERPENLLMIQNQLSRFMTENTETNFNELLRKALLVRTQKNQTIFWNEFLSWFFVQQKEYGKAFVQEKAIYKRNPETISNIVALAQMAVEEEEEETAKEILTFIITNTQDLDLQIQSHYFLIEIQIKNTLAKDFKSVEIELEQRLKQFGINPYTLQLQILQAHFLTFHLNNPAQGKAILETALDLPLNKYQVADIKMELADVLLYDQKFNQALLYYTQIEDDLKNDAVGHQASLKAAKTSYFKADFAWALSQFKVLKTASTQLIANDALELFLLLNDNTVADSTQTALKEFARADYLLYQNKNQEALSQFQAILKNFKGKEIESVTLLRLGKTHEKMGDYDLALSQYQAIIDHHQEGIYIDEALYFSAEIENKKYKQFDPSPEGEQAKQSAKALYEKIVFNHQDSIYFIEARKKFRQLRGDANL